tara:strand:+ start:378 stop:944 length:567 start_codon:yes stop_codon:yes gene_type:complete
MAYKRDLSKPLAPTFGDDKPKRKVKRKTKQVIYTGAYGEERKKYNKTTARQQFKKDKGEFYGVDSGVKKTTKRKDGSVKKTKSIASGSRPGKEVLTKSKVKYNKDGSVKKSKTTVKSLTGKTKTKTNQKGQTKTKNVAFKNKKKEDKLDVVGRRKASQLIYRQDTKAAKAKKKAAPKKRRVVTRTKNK